MRVRDYFVLAQSLPPKRIVQKGIRRIRGVIKEYFRKRRDFKGSTYVFPISYKIEKLYGYFGPPPLCYLQTKANEIAGVAELYLEHRFDLLGSGWVQVKHGMTCGGIEGYRYQMGMKILADQEGQWLKGRVNSSNLKMSEQIWQLVDTDYVPIDWHLDFKSGYRWPENTWYLRIPYGHKPGVDIKVPWELTRMQHLTLLAWAYTLAKGGQPGFRASQDYLREFRNQVLDFIATNPPRFGVNWRSTMDVAIRIANWLVGYDLIRACGGVFDDSFETTFFHSIYQHGEHIVNNLEWDERFRGNHYLSNVVGLLFVASYLPCSPETDTWLALANQELVHEVGHQFNKDGGNFEASTSYHRLSTEMAVYGTGLTLGLPYEKRSALKKYDCHLLKGGPKLRPGPVTLHPLPGGEIFNPFPLWYLEKLEKMAEFTMHLIKPNGHIPQIGDNDSGRFFKFQPLFHLMKVDETGAQSIDLNNSISLSDTGHYWDEDHLDHRHLLAAINALFGREDFTEFTGSGWIETEIVKQLAKGVILPSYKGSDEPTAAEQKYIHESEVRGRICGGNASQPMGKVFSKKNETSIGNKVYAYQEFGMFIFKSKYIYLAIRCGPNGQNGNGGHAHNDNLSFELNVRGRDFIIDGGSYLYTPFPNIRNVFRSTKAHNTLILNGREQNDWADGLVGLFSMRDDAHARVLKFSNEYFRGEHSGFGPNHCRELIIRDSSLIIYDMIEITLPNEINFNLSPEVEVISLREKSSEEFSLEIGNGEDHLTMSLEGFNKVESSSGYYSSGYGRRVKNTLVRCCRSKPRTSVEISFG